MSMYTVGEIARLAEIARPEVGVVLSVHPTHLQRAGSIERIAEAKSELPRALPGDGLAVLNADDARVAAMRDLTPAAVRTFGLDAAASARSSPPMPAASSTAEQPTSMTSASANSGASGARGRPTFLTLPSIRRAPARRTRWSRAQRAAA
jgi:UDP-N-acetylmuramyl pentapeptide synthase